MMLAIIPATGVVTIAALILFGGENAPPPQTCWPLTKGNVTIEVASLPENSTVMRIESPELHIEKAVEFRTTVYQNHTFKVLKNIISTKLTNIHPEKEIIIRVQNSKREWRTFQITPCTLFKEGKLWKYIFPDSGYGIKFDWRS